MNRDELLEEHLFGLYQSYRNEEKERDEEERELKNYKSELSYEYYLLTNLEEELKNTLKKLKKEGMYYQFNTPIRTLKYKHDLLKKLISVIEFQAENEGFKNLEEQTMIFFKTRNGSFINISNVTNIKKTRSGYELSYLDRYGHYIYDTDMKDLEEILRSKGLIIEKGDE